jgi:site-specific DNA-methyltransferase (adenine-specific)
MPQAKTAEWETPLDLFLKLDAEFHFDMDVCASAENAKCGDYWTAEDDGLAQPWYGLTCWCNPPYGREISKWVKKAAESGATVVMLLPARTDTRWFHDYVYRKAEIRFIRGRLKFGGARNAAPFPSMIVVFRPNIPKLP